MPFLRPGDINYVLAPGELASIPDWVVRGYPIDKYPELRHIFIDVVWPACGHIIEFYADCPIRGNPSKARWDTRKRIQVELAKQEDEFASFVEANLPSPHKRIRWTRDEVTMDDGAYAVTWQQFGFAAYTNQVAAHLSTEGPFVVEDDQAQIGPNFREKWYPKDWDGLLRLLKKGFQ